jgi:phosphatidylinositol N-acetylglucosaminyltransferase subunit A
VLRANLPPKSVHVIPNAIVADHFRPARLRPPTDTSQYLRLMIYLVLADPLTRTVRRTVTVIVISRLAYRKGIDLLVATAPRICAAFHNVRFVVGTCLQCLDVISLVDMTLIQVVTGPKWWISSK